MRLILLKENFASFNLNNDIVLVYIRYRNSPNHGDMKVNETQAGSSDLILAIPVSIRVNRNALSESNIIIL